MLYIATTNENKIKRLKTILKHLYGNKLSVRDISLLTLKKPVENGINEIGNVSIKAYHYFSLLGANTLAEDVGVYFDNININHGHNFKNFLQNKKTGSKHEHVRAYLAQNNIKSGHFRYAYGLKTFSGLYVSVFDIPFKVNINAKNKKSTSGNVLNNFVVPYGYDHVFAEMTQKQLREYRIDNFGRNIEKFLDKHREIFDI